MKLRTVWIGALALALAVPVSAQDGPAWRPVDAETGKIRDVEGLEQLAEDFPDSGSVRLRLLQAQLGEGDSSAVLASLTWLKERGYVFSEGAQAQIPELLGADHAEAAKALLIAEPKTIEASTVVATLPAEAGLIESVLKDPATGNLVATSYSEGAIWQYESPESHLEYSISDYSRFSGIVIDPISNQTWISIGALSHPIEPAKTAPALTSLCLDLECTGQLSVVNFAAESLNDLHATHEGTLYASDSIGGGIYRRATNSKTLEQFIAPGTLRSPQGIASSEDWPRRLFVSDYRYGIAMIDTSNGVVARLASDVPVLLDGIDGLWFHDGELIAVQNGTSPMRISAFTLSEDGARIIAARVLEQAHNGWTEPLGGSIADDALIYVATGQWDRYDKGVLRDGLQAIPTDIRRLPLK